MEGQKRLEYGENRRSPPSSIPLVAINRSAGWLGLLPALSGGTIMGTIGMHLW